MNCEISSTWTFPAGGVTAAVIVIVTYLLTDYTIRRRYR